MHRIAGPEDRMTLPPGGAEERGKGGLDAVMAHAGDEGDATGRVVRVEPVQEAAKRIGIKARSAFDADRIGEAAGEFDMSRAGETGAVADRSEEHTSELQSLMRS